MALINWSMCVPLNWQSITIVLNSGNNEGQTTIHCLINWFSEATAFSNEMVINTGKWNGENALKNIN